jgi:hypothetical protein
VYVVCNGGNDYEDRASDKNRPLPPFPTQLALDVYWGLFRIRQFALPSIHLVDADAVSCSSYTGQK